jgi:phospholipid transport system substrate-binding protein
MRPQMHSVEPQPNLFGPVYRRLVIVAFFLTLLAASVARGRADPSDTSKSDPMAELKSAISEAIALFQNQSMPLDQRREKLRDLATRRFDFAVMARSVLGYHWRELNADQRSQFIPVFGGFIQDAYLSKLRDYTVQKVQQEVQTLNIQYTRETFDGPDYAQVNTSVKLQEQKDPVQVNYLMHLDSGHWRIYDVTIDAISVIANYRNQFNRVINSNGYDQLVADLKSKQQQFRQTLDQSDSSATPH